MIKNRKHESGNVLVYILIAVALLGSLSYVVAQSSRGNGGSVSEEKAKLITAEILEYSNNLTAAVAQLKLRGCSDVEISFENSTSTLDYANSNSPTDNTCHVFNIAGGGIEYATPQSDWLDSSYSAEDTYQQLYIPRNVCVVGIGPSPDTATSCQLGNDHSDLILTIPFLKENICNEINESLGNGLTTPPTDSNNALGPGALPFKGSYGNPYVFRSSAGELDYKRSACFRASNNPSDAYIYYKVLIAR